MPDAGKSFSAEEVAEVLAKYPGLTVNAAGEVEGILDIDAAYKGRRIQDSYVVRIAASNPHSERLPALYEVGGRTENVGKKYNVPDLRHLHRNPDGIACVCVKQEESRLFPPGSRLVFFVDRLVVDYLYGLSHYDQFKKWPWGEFSHGVLGLLEFYVDDIKPQSSESIAEVLASMQRNPSWPKVRKQLRSPSSKRDCFCGSGNGLGRCHNLAWRGLQRFRGEIARLNLFHLIR